MLTIKIDEWEENQDESTGRIYYYNRTTGATTFTNPYNSHN